ncbi:MAG: type II toxin-antitoxin system VapC family toxin [Pyrinomonadaceae bacterium]
MAFWDSSAIVPLCINEDISQKARMYWRRFDECNVWAETSVEISSALARRHREGELNDSERLVAEKRLDLIESKWMPVGHSSRITELARTFPNIHGLRALDSLQLASALVWCKEFPNGRAFVSADSRLLEAAETVGFTIHDLT